MLASNDRHQGIVSDFDSARGCGIIEDDSGEYVFVRYSAIQGAGLRTLKRGDRVSFYVEHRHRGPIAVRVVRHQSGA